MNSADIQRELDHYFIYELDIKVSTPEPYWWESEARAAIEYLGPTHALGWGAPINANGEGLVFPYCPQRIEERIAGLEEHEIAEALSLIKYMGARHIILMDMVEDVESRHAMILDEFSGMLAEDVYAYMEADREASVDDEFSMMMSGIEFEVDEAPLLIPASLSDEELRAAYGLDKAKMRHPRFDGESKEGRDLLAEFYSLELEMTRRNML